MRTCSSCRLDETKTEFTPKGIYCRPCSAAKHKEWAAKNKERLRVYAAKWLAAHREEVNARYRDAKREATRRYRAANREKVNAMQRERRRRTDPEKNRQRQRDWQKKNPDRHRELSRRDYEKCGRERQKARRETINAQRREWYRTHREEMIGKVIQKMAKRKGAAGSHTVAEWKSVLRHNRRRCFYCGTKLDAANLSRDHKIPLKRGGTHDIRNIVPACRSCNSSKGAKTHEEFLALSSKPGLGCQT